MVSPFLDSQTVAYSAVQFSGSITKGLIGSGTDQSGAPRNFDDYQLTIDEAKLPEGITIEQPF
jgi:hypothetical protein